MQQPALTTRRVIAALAWSYACGHLVAFALGGDSAQALISPSMALYRESLMWIIAGAASVLLVLGAGLKWRREAVGAFLDGQAVWCGIAVMVLLPPLSLTRLFMTNEILHHGALALFGAAAAFLVHTAVPRFEPCKGWQPSAWLVTVLAATAFGAYFSQHSIYMHYRFETHAFDLANYEQTLWNTVQGRFFATSYVEGNSFLSHHFSLSLMVLAAFYALVPQTETILIFQAAVLAIAALPLYAFAARRLQGHPAALLVVLAYLLSPLTQIPVFYDFHDVAMLPLGVFTLLWGLDTRRHGVAILATAFLAGAKEEGALLAAGVLCFVAIEAPERRKPLALGIGLLGLYFVVVKAVIMPAIAGGAIVHLFYYERLIPAGGTGMGSVLATLLANPWLVLRELLTAPKLLHFMRLFAPLLFLPLFLRRNLLLFAVPVAIVFLASYQPVYDFTFQYNYYLVPFLFAGLITTLGQWANPKRSLTAAAAVLCLVSVHNWHYGPVLQREGKTIRFGQTMRWTYEQSDRQRYEAVNKVLALIPPHASVAASETLGPHLARRELLYRSSDLRHDVDYQVVWSVDEAKFERAMGKKQLAAKFAQVHRSHGITIYARKSLVGH